MGLLEKATRMRKETELPNTWYSDRRTVPNKKLLGLAVVATLMLGLTEYHDPRESKDVKPKDIRNYKINQYGERE